MKVFVRWNGTKIKKASSLTNDIDNDDDDDDDCDNTYDYDDGKLIFKILGIVFDDILTRTSLKTILQLSFLLVREKMLLSYT